MKNLRFVSAVMCFLLNGAAYAQEPDEPQPNARVMGPGPGKTLTPSRPAVKPADSAAAVASAIGLIPSARGYGPFLAICALHANSDRLAGPPSPRLQRLEQLQFDRKPSTILKAWAEAS